MAAQAILPSVLDSLGLLPPDERVPDERLGDALLPVSIAAVSAADAGGTEVAGGRVSGEERGPRGRWAQLRHRISSQCPRRKSQRHSRLTCPMRSTSPHGITHSAWQFDTGS